MRSNPGLFFSQKWKAEDPDGLCKQTMDAFYEKVKIWQWNDELDITDSPILPVVHGTDDSIAWSVAQGGFAALSSLDDGFYGRGMYFSSSTLYTIPYFCRAKKPTIVVCLTIPGNPYPVIVGPKDKGSLLKAHIMTGHQSHYVVTGKGGYPFLPAVDKKKYDELVLEMEEQVLPIFIVNVKMSNLSTLIQNYQREVPQTIANGTEE